MNSGDDGLSQGNDQDLTVVDPRLDPPTSSSSSSQRSQSQRSSKKNGRRKQEAKNEVDGRSKTNKNKTRAPVMSDEASVPQVEEPGEGAVVARQHSTSLVLDSMAPPPRRPTRYGNPTRQGGRTKRYRDKMYKYDSQHSIEYNSGRSMASEGGLVAPENPDAYFDQVDPEEDDPLEEYVTPGAVSVSMTQGVTQARNKGHLTLLNSPMDEESLRQMNERRASQGTTTTANGAYLEAVRRDEFSDELPGFSTPPKRTWWSITRFKLVLVILVILAIVVVCIVVLRSRSSSQEEDVNVDARRNAAFSLLSLISSQESLGEEGTPQNLAFEWVVNKDQLSGYALGTLGQDLTKLIQRYVLAVFYYATGGETEWISTRNWLNPLVDECLWKFVSCNDVGQATMIDTGSSGNGVSGTVPGEVGFLSSLLHLLLRGNSIVGLSEDLRRLSNLESLQLDLNSLSGSIPSVIYKMTSLESIILGENSLSGTISPEISNLSRLTNLDMWINQLTGRFPFESLPSIQIVHLSSNSLEGDVNEIIPFFQNLVDLDLSFNKFSGNIPSEIGNIQNLEALNLNRLDLSSSIPTEIGLVTSLKSMSVIATGITGTVPSELGNLTNLEKLEIPFNLLTGSIPLGVCNLPVLELLTLDCAALECSCCNKC